MKAVILAGGLGTRLAEETHSRPKPMVEVGGMPILVHIMKIFSFYGVNDFIICLGYKGYFIKEYFNNFHLRNSDVTFNIENNSKKVIQNIHQNWNITCVDTGDKTLTGGRIKRVREYLDQDEPFFLTYGDGVADINLRSLLDFHHAHGKLATVTAVNPPSRFGMLKIDEQNEVKQFNEKPNNENTWINGGYFVLHPSVIDYIDGDMTSWEVEPLQKITKKSELAAFKHSGFWQPMDTLSEKKMLNDLYAKNMAPWKIW
jgi:glucose-1-phosphate cytidylyltransferase